MLVKHMLRSGILLALFATAGTGLVALTYDNTKDRIAEAEREAMLQKLHSIIPPSEHNNDIFTDYIVVNSPKLLGPAKEVYVFRARMNSKPVAVLITPTAPDGYNGDIKLLVGIRYNGELAGVRVLEQKETPGLGDGIEEQKSRWIYQFDGRSSHNPELKNWKVTRDGGVFDQLAGATITPRAVVKAVKKTLEYYDSNKDFLFNEGFNKKDSDDNPQTQRQTGDQSRTGNQNHGQ
jgi:electron transport complex protein RnfG